MPFSSSRIPIIKITRSYQSIFVMEITITGNKICILNNRAQLISLVILQWIKTLCYHLNSYLFAPFYLRSGRTILLLTPISHVPLISQFSPLSKLITLNTIEYHFHIWQVSPHLSCGDIRQIPKWFKELSRYLCRIKYFLDEEIRAASVTPTNTIILLLLYNHVAQYATAIPALYLAIRFIWK